MITRMLETMRMMKKINVGVVVESHWGFDLLQDINFEQT